MKAIYWAALALGLSLTPALAQDDFAPPRPAEAAELVAKPIPSGPTNGGAALTASDVAAFSDGLVPASLAEGDIAGAVVVVVKGGQVLFQKGYGVSDVATRAPVDPERTLFRPGSVSKLFVWTSIMQLVGEGKLDLDRDINAYLDFTVPPAFGKPITLRNLMTHTAGFEEALRPLVIGGPGPLEALDKLLKDSMPARVYPPGEVPAYSNYGATLAGYIVQRVSGENFNDYVQRHIFAPLGMKHATFVQPLPAALSRDMSKGYANAAGAAVPFEMISMAPAGGLSASGGDIARFMLAHLGDGAYGDARILPAQLAVRMHGTAFRPFADLPPMAYGFYHEDMNGHVLIQHDGDTGVFHSMLTLVLDANTGIFISVNSSGRDFASGKLRAAYLLGFMARYFPPPPQAAMPTLPSAHEDGQKIAGTYQISRRGETNFMRFVYLFQPFSIALNPDDTITVNALVDFAGHPKKWREVKPFVWREVNGDRYVQAKLRDARIEQVGSDQFGPVVVLQPAPLSTSSAWNTPLLFATLGMLALTVLFWPLKAVLRWRYERPLPLTGRARLLYRLTRLVALLDFVFLAGWPIFLLTVTARLESHGAGSDLVLRAIQVLGVIGILGTPAPVLNFAFGLKDPSRPWWTKASDLLIVLAALATVWFAFSENLLTWSLKY